MKQPFFAKVYMTTVPIRSRPLVSIGVPAYNVERYIARALDSLLSQTLTDFEIIISDNASTDGTRAICENYASGDPRVRYIRQEDNIGAPRNWNALVHEARGVFFKWASASDYCSPVMIEKCVNVMQSDPGVVLCYGNTQFVDEHENPISIYDDEVGFEESCPSVRIAHICDKMTINNLQCGVMRLDVLRRTRLDRLYPSGDLALMAELALYGRFKLLPDLLLFRRQTPDSSTSMLTALERQRVYDPQARRAAKLIVTRRHLDYAASITRSPLSVKEKLRAYRNVFRIVRWRDGIKILRELFSLFGIYIVAR